MFQLVIELIMFQSLKIKTLLVIIILNNAFITNYYKTFSHYGGPFERNFTVH